MHIVIFAGGAGTRLWPLSRENSPKQFTDLRDGVSTLQMAVERIRPFGLKNVYISTNDSYEKVVRAQVPDLTKENILREPVRRDLAAAVGLTLTRIKLRGASGPVAVIWSDHFMKHPEKFQEALRQAEKLVSEKVDRLVFIGEEPRYANHNLGWIHIGKKIKDNQYKFLGWKYRPDLTLCEKMFASESWMWNPGYFIFDIDFMLGLYKKFQPKMYEELQKMGDDHGIIKEKYGNLESLHFDNAIVEKVDQDQAVVLKVNMGWSDPGTLYALKEALEPNEKKNFEKGQVISHNCADSFIYNEERKKLVAAVGLQGMIVVNTPDAILVCHRDSVPEIKELLAKIKEKGLGEYL